MKGIFPGPDTGPASRINCELGLRWPHLFSSTASWPRAFHNTGIAPCILAANGRRCADRLFLAGILQMRHEIVAELIGAIRRAKLPDCFVSPVNMGEIEFDPVFSRYAVPGGRG